jgi:hypothetical protein
VLQFVVRRLLLDLVVGAALLLWATHAALVRFVAAVLFNLTNAVIFEYRHLPVAECWARCCADAAIPPLS